jgi:hypothetical protein
MPKARLRLVQLKRLKNTKMTNITTWQVPNIGPGTNPWESLALFGIICGVMYFLFFRKKK